MPHMISFFNFGYFFWKVKLSFDLIDFNLHEPFDNRPLVDECLQLIVDMSILNIAWKISSLIIAEFIGFELIVVSPILLLVYIVYRASIYIAPDVFSIFPSISASKARRILLCVDPTSISSVNWITKELQASESDEVIVVHVIEPTESIQIPSDSVTFNTDTIDTKDFFIPQYVSEFCHWLQRNQISYEGILMRPLPRCTVAETLLKVAQKYSVDCIVASASERAGT